MFKGQLPLIYLLTSNYLLQGTYVYFLLGWLVCLSAGKNYWPNFNETWCKGVAFALQVAILNHLNVMLYWSYTFHILTIDHKYPLV